MLSNSTAALVMTSPQITGSCCPNVCIYVNACVIQALCFHYGI